MAGLTVKTKPLVSRTKSSPPDVGTAVNQLENSGNPLLSAAAGAFRNVQSNLNDILSTLRNTNPEVTEVVVHDSTGKVVGFIGDFEFSGVVTRNYFSEIHIGDPLGTGDPTQSVINVNANGQITVGSTGWVDVLDPFGADAAWIGTQYDTLAVTGAADNGAGLIRLTVPAHGFITGDSAIVLNVGGVPNATGVFALTVIDATHVDLQASVFVGAFTSGGTINRLLHVTGAANNGAGLIRLTVVAHGYESGDKVNVVGVGGVPNATGQWIITVISANTFDLRASTFAGAFTAGGTVQRYFAGGLFQTIAVGPSFANYNLRAFPDGTLKINGATITLTGTNGTILLDPTVPAITVADGAGNQWAALEIVQDAPKTISAATNASPVVVTLNAHGYSNGDTIIVAGATGNTAINGYRIVQGVTANTFTLTNIAGAAVNGNGAFSGTTTATRYYAGGLFESIAIGPSWASAKLRAYADGSLAINNATIRLAGTNATITFDPAVGSISLIGNGGIYSENVVISAQDDPAGNPAGIVVQSTSSPTLDYMSMSHRLLTMYANAGLGSMLRTYMTPGNIVLNDTTATQTVSIQGNTGSATFNGPVKTFFGFNISGAAGLSVTRSFGTSLTVNTLGTGLFGTPGAGQSNGTVVTGVTLNVTSNQYAGGILIS